METYRERIQQGVEKVKTILASHPMTFGQLVMSSGIKANELMLVLGWLMRDDLIAFADPEYESKREDLGSGRICLKAQENLPQNK